MFNYFSDWGHGFLNSCCWTIAVFVINNCFTIFWKKDFSQNERLSDFVVTVLWFNLG